jgi:peptidyl-prolyl cis-trans isomerase-like 2
MGKQRHTQDRMYLSAKEHATFYGGYREAARTEGVRRLGFDCCALSQGRFTDPVLAPDGTVYELTQIVPFLRRHKRNPSTGDPLSGKELVPLHYHANGEGQLACPVTGKVFTDNSKIGAVRTTGNVYSWEALEELCLGPKHWKDLLTDAPFGGRADIVLLQDPSDPAWLARHNVNAFWYIKEKVPVDGGGAGAGEGGAVPVATSTGVIRMNDAARRVLAEVEAADIKGFGGPAAAGAAAADSASGSSSAAAHVNEAGVRTTGRLASSLMSTGVGVVTRNAPAPLTDADRREARWAGVKALGRKAFVRLVTSAGPLNLELHADLVPRTVDNFLTLAKRGYYDGTPFHRVIRNFMIQGGDPTGTGKGGASAWGAPFRDEFHPKLGHAERGVLSMANSGPDSNGSQFFVTFKSCPHLDRKHAVFGRLVGGGDTLRALELTPTGKDDRPTSPLTLLRVDVFQDPFKEWEDAQAAKAAAAAEAAAAAAPSAAASSSAGGGGLSAALAAAPKPPGAAAAGVKRPAPPAGGLLAMLPPVGTRGGDGGVAAAAAASAASSSSSAAAPPVVGRYLNLSGGAAAATAAPKAPPAAAAAAAAALGVDGYDDAPAAKKPKTGSGGSDGGFGSFTGW